YAIRLILDGVDRNYIQSDSPWGSSAPSFYFRQMFLDGRDMWILPHAAVLGLALLTIGWIRRGRFETREGFIAFWALLLVFVFSFFVFSIDPLKFIPKQDNYALMFVAPVALLAGYAISRLSRSLVIGVLCFFAAGALSLSAL